MHNIPLVQIQPEERLAATSELNSASSLVTGCGAARGMGYWAATQVKGLSHEIFIVPEADVVLLTEGCTLIADSLIGTWQGDASPAGSETVARYQMDIMGTREAVQRSYLLVLWVQVPPLQFSVGNVVISDSGWSDPMAESSEVKAFYREASNQKGRSESERNRRRNIRYCSCQVSSAPRRWLLSLLEETEGCTQGSYRRTEGGNSGENSRESSEGLRTSQDDPGMTKTVPITEEGNGKEVCRLADEVGKWGSQDMINLVERGPLGSGETARTLPPDSVLGYGC